MKLHSLTNIYNIVYSVIILIIAGFFLQITLFRTYYKQIDDRLKTERVIIEQVIENFDTVPNYSDIFGHQIQVSLLQTSTPDKNIFKDLLLYNSKTKSNVLYRNHFFSGDRKNGMGYSINILKPLSDLDKYKKLVLISISLAFVFLLIAFLCTGYFVNRRLWHPFYKTLEDLNQFNIDAPTTLRLAETKIYEFMQLNQYISSLTRKLRRDFIRMKEFTENLSHEINTMLAIIMSKVELLLQKEDLADEQVEHFKTIYQVTNKLAHLNNGLLLLAKIDNEYYSSTEPIDFSVLIEEHLQSFEDFIRQNNLRVNTNLTSVRLNMNKSLANVLISNIIINAIKHNIQNGYIEISLKEGEICVENSGVADSGSEKDNSDSENRIDKRFKSLGMGLEIIKRICRIYNFATTYSAENGIHRNLVRFFKNTDKILNP